MSDLTRIVRTAALLGASGLLWASAPAWAQDSGASRPPEPVPAAEPAAEPAPDSTAARPEPAAPESTATPPVEPAPAPRVDLPPPPPPEDDLPIPTLSIDRVPPNTSYEMAVQVSYGEVAYFLDSVPPWVGFGFRGGWGKNLGLHRVGVAGTFAAEGDIGVHTLLALEPSATWDFVSGGGLLLGAGVGPSLFYTVQNSTVITERSLEVAPAAAVRLGWSQTWSRVGRRLFVFLEPKVRFAEGELVPVVAVAVGSGGGR